MTYFAKWPSERQRSKHGLASMWLLRETLVVSWFQSIRCVDRGGEKSDQEIQMDWFIRVLNAMWGIFSLFCKEQYFLQEFTWIGDVEKLVVPQYKGQGDPSCGNCHCPVTNGKARSMWVELPRCREPTGWRLNQQSLVAAERWWWRTWTAVGGAELSAFFYLIRFPNNSPSGK